jgi:hypothetical protein
MKVKIWYSYRHDDYSVAEVELELAEHYTLFSVGQRISRDGGIVLDGRFVPFHKIGCIEEAE